MTSGPQDAEQHSSFSGQEGIVDWEGQQAAAKAWIAGRLAPAQPAPPPEAPCAPTAPLL